MPTYSYQCKKCAHVLDVFHGISARPRIKCDQCGTSCVRLFGAGAGIIFKGSGFYATDYKKSGNGGDGKTGSAAKSETKSESKPAEAKGESKGTSKKSSGATAES